MEASRRSRHARAHAVIAHIFEAIEKTAPSKNGEVQLTDALRILLKKRRVYAFEFEAAASTSARSRTSMRANLILGLEQEPWRSTIEDVIAEHPEGRRIARRVAAAGKPAGERRTK